MSQGEPGVHTPISVKRTGPLPEAWLRSRSELRAGQKMEGIEPERDGYEMDGDTQGADGAGQGEHGGGVLGYQFGLGAARLVFDLMMGSCQRGRLFFRPWQWGTINLAWVYRLWSRQRHQGIVRGQRPRGVRGQAEGSARWAFAHRGPTGSGRIGGASTA